MLLNDNREFMIELNPKRNHKGTIIWEKIKRYGIG